jgi:hypothetical protein
MFLEPKDIFQGDATIIALLILLTIFSYKPPPTVSMDRVIANVLESMTALAGSRPGPTVGLKVLLALIRAGALSILTF